MTMSENTKRLLTEVRELRAAMRKIAPYKDVIICYASTCSEHEGNRVSKAFDDALAAPGKRGQV